uniref:Uncharacterized protein n=1 Tax=Rhizophora mucronata TaxID=61149 RepID=A0A2P2MXW1_RHIMU
MSVMACFLDLSIRIPNLIEMLRASGLLLVRNGLKRDTFPGCMLLVMWCLVT